MLSASDNAVLTQTGPGTPIGQFMRAHWFPFMRSEELVPDGPPKRIKLLGEQLVAFRDSDNQVGLVAEHCPHRRASLYFGRNEESGIRSTTGVAGIRSQDALVTESSGAIVDRSLEHLGPSDRAVIAFRRWVLRQAKNALDKVPATAKDGSRYRTQAVQLWADDDSAFNTLPEAQIARGPRPAELASD